MSMIVYEFLFFLIFCIIILMNSIVRLHENEYGVVYRLGKPLKKFVGPRTILILPFIDKLEKMSSYESWKSIELYQEQNDGPSIRRKS